MFLLIIFWAVYLSAHRFSVRRQEQNGVAAIGIKGFLAHICRYNAIFCSVGLIQSVEKSVDRVEEPERVLRVYVVATIGDSDEFTLRQRVTEALGRVFG